MIVSKRICLLTIVLLYCSLGDGAINKTFPKNFKFGVATSAYQVEGAWNVDGKGENIWDHLCHTNPSFIKNSNNGDIACDSYHKYKEDVQLLKDLGVNHYRFSLSWSRILPTGFPDEVNQAGVHYYKNLISELKKANIEPLVTLYHFDLPQPLQDIGGWPNLSLAEHFANYARIAFEIFGDDVKHWVTFNEPKLACHYSYGTGNLAPAIVSPGLEEYLCGHTVLKAHAAAYHIYQVEFKPKQNGRISIAFDCDWYEPASNSAEDIAAAETQLQFECGWFLNPIFHGNYPEVMIQRIRERSQKEGFSISRLPEFSEKELNFIRGTADFLGLNTYSTFLTKSIAEPEIGEPSFEKDIGVETYQDPNWDSAANSSFKIVPWGARKLLVWLKKTYGNPEILITENGVSDSGTLDDDIRIHYHKEYLSYILEAILEDEVNVAAYTVWGLLDNFEWFNGYSTKYGLYKVDFQSPNRTRTPKKSVNYYKQIIKTHCLVDSCED